MLEKLARRLLSRRRLLPETGCWLWTGATDQKGYGRISVAGVDWRVHVLAACCWLGRSLQGRRPVGRTCTCPACFNPAHLVVSNGLDRLARLQKRRARGERSGRHKITEAQARQIVAAVASGKELHEEIARRVGASVVIVWDIARGRTWKHLQGGD